MKRFNIFLQPLAVIIIFVFNIIFLRYKRARERQGQEDKTDAVES